MYDNLGTSDLIESGSPSFTLWVCPHVLHAKVVAVLANDCVRYCVVTASSRVVRLFWSPLFFSFCRRSSGRSAGRTVIRPATSSVGSKWSTPFQAHQDKYRIQPKLFSIPTLFFLIFQELDKVTFVFHTRHKTPCTIITKKNYKKRNNSNYFWLATFTTLFFHLNWLLKIMEHLTYILKYFFVAFAIFPRNKLL